MNKILTLIIFNMVLMSAISSYAATPEPSISVNDFEEINADVNELIIGINDEITDKAKQMGLLIAANSHDQEVIIINEEIDEINEEMKELGEEFSDEMAEMGKELKGLVKILRKMGDKESGKGAFLGILLDEDKGVDEGILLLGVTPNGPAQNAGLQADDIITNINEESMSRNQDSSPASKLYSTLKTVKPGEQINVVINRNGKEKHIVFSAGKRSDHLQSGINFLADDLEKRIHKKTHGMMDHEAFSGIELYPLNNKLGNYFGSDNGMLILNIPDNNKFNLQQGDVILKIGERSPKSTSQTWRILESYDSGEKINLTVMRNQQEIQISINKP